MSRTYLKFGKKRRFSRAMGRVREKAEAGTSSWQLYKGGDIQKDCPDKPWKDGKLCRNSASDRYKDDRHLENKQLRNFQKTKTRKLVEEALAESIED